MEDTYAFLVRVLLGFMGSVDNEPRAGKQVSIVSGKVKDALVTDQWVCSKGPQGKSRCAGACCPQN